MNFKIFIFLFLSSLLSCLLFNLANLKIQNEHKTITLDSIPRWRTDNKYTISDVTIWSPDNEYYINPAINLIKYGELRQDPRVGNGSFFRRVPVYSLVYYFIFKAVGESYVIYGLIALQILLYCLSSVVVFSIISDISNRLVAWILSVFYVIIPWFHSYTFFSITEGITPFLMLFFLYFVLSAFYNNNLKKKIFLYFLASFLISLAILTRPTNGLGLILLGIAILKEFNKVSRFNFFKLLAIIAVVPFLMFGGWIYRNYKISGEIVFLEKAYHPQSLDRQKPEWKGLFSFTKSWGEDGSYFNSYNLPLFYNAIDGNTEDKFVDLTIKAWPGYVINYFGYQRLFDIVKRYQMVTFQQKAFYQNKSPLPSNYLKEQIHLENDFEKLKKEFARAFPIQFYILTPFKYFKDIILHSNTSHLAIFQKQYIQNQVFTFLRHGLVIVHILLYINILLNMYLLRNSSVQLWGFCIIPLAYIIFFSFYFQQIEQRYMFPILPWLFIGLFKPIEKLVFFIQKNGRFKKTYGL